MSARQPPPPFIRVEQCECLELRDRQGELASIRLGERDGRWFFALAFQQRSGDLWGSAGPLGFTEGSPRRDFGSRIEALQGAIAHARDCWTGRHAELAPHLVWLNSLIPDQPDLFEKAA